MSKKKKNYSDETIAAIATPQGTGSISIIRLSGTDALTIGEKIVGRALKPRYAHSCKFISFKGDLIDKGLAIFFPNPQSFTGEDVVELHCHGGIIISDMLLNTAYHYGARGANPGEFSLRAFLNDKIDLTQAEAIADLISSSSAEAARSALRSLEGVFSDKINTIQNQLTKLRVHIEAFLDFPEEEIDPKEQAELDKEFYIVYENMSSLVKESKQGVILNTGINIVIAGPTNAGKSSLLNRLAGYSTAIVTDIPGTTRDTLKEKITIDGLAINVTDTAGIRETTDPVEQEGISRAGQAIEASDCLIWVCDISSDIDQNIKDAKQLAEGKKTILVLNKIDLINKPAKLFELDNLTVVQLSVLTGEGMGVFLKQLISISGYSPNSGGTFSARSRHIESLEKSKGILSAAMHNFKEKKALELAAEDLRMVQRALSEITGELTSDDLLGEIFASFCIGK
ncbi:MAG: tRNA uridine-5-carboxymethylaminomethyl(34) synthesis GTPase MnmE [Pseudomonadota bacterium]|nr:tRNA uridine-5-carboxymethylaminomethyl(34) synthesis GTPase MnmE [Pseudomonadota bacterium]